MNPELDYAVAFTAGLMASGHCIGMCGGLVSAFFMRLGDSAKRPLIYVAYHGSRIAVYALAGTLAALLGHAVVSTGGFGMAQRVLQITAGVVVILLGIDILGLPVFRLPFLRMPVGLFRQVFFAASQKGPLAGAATGGMLNGFLPCAMTLAMAVKATTATYPLQGTLLMVAFGLGTVPSMLFVSAVSGRLGANVRSWLYKGAAVLVVGLGVMTVYKGVTHFSGMHGQMPHQEHTMEGHHM